VVEELHVEEDLMFKNWVLATLTVVALANVSSAQVINEFVNNHVGTDTHEFVEFFGQANTDYSNLWIVEIEGDGSTAGLIDDMTFQVGTTDANGFWWTGFQPNVPENGTLTYLLVEGYTGSTNDDIDTDNDGIIDAPFWTSIIDCVGVTDGGAGDLTYCSTVLDSTLEGSSGFTPGAASRIPNGVDTDSAADWVRNDFDGAGLPGFTGSLDAGEALNTPNAVNQIPEPTTLALLSLGLVAARRNRK